MLTVMPGWCRLASLRVLGRAICQQISSDGQCRSFSTKPTTIEAAFIKKYKDVLTFGPNPSTKKCGETSIRIGVKFCALNLYDYNYMWGKCAPTLPFIPGSEVSGVVLEVGQKCTRGFQVGDKVFALPVRKYMGGGLSSEFVVREAECHSVGSLSLEQAVALPLSYGTAHYTLSRLCQLKPNDDIVIFASIGGDGLAAIQIASKLYQPRIHAVCDTDNSRSLPMDDSLYQVINGKGSMTRVYKTFDATFSKDKLKKLKTVIDGGNCAMLHVACDFLSQSGQFFTSDPQYSAEHIGGAKPDFRKVTNKTIKQNPIELNESFERINSRTKAVDFASLQQNDPGLFEKILSEVVGMHAKGDIQPYISQIFPFKDANKALKYIQGRKCLGKVLVEFETNI